MAMWVSMFAAVRVAAAMRLFSASSRAAVKDWPILTAIWVSNGSITATAKMMLVDQSERIRGKFALAAGAGSVIGEVPGWPHEVRSVHLLVNFHNR